MKPSRPKIVCLCGSTRFSEAFQEANLRETLAGHIVLSIGTNLKSDAELFDHLPPHALQSLKDQLDELHLRKIDLADEVLILDVDGYIGESTSRERRYAQETGKTIRYWSKLEGKLETIWLKSTWIGILDPEKV